MNAIPKAHPASPDLQYLPRGTMMVAGYGMATSARPWTSPTDRGPLRQVFWNCGAVTNERGGVTFKVSTPMSLWPYACHSLYEQKDNSPAENIHPFRPDGAIGHVVFPICLKNRTVTGPNTNAWYVAKGVDAGYTDSKYDLRYPDGAGMCVGDDKYIPQVSFRIHTLDMNPCGFGLPTGTDAQIDQQCGPSGVSGANVNGANVRYRFKGTDGSTMPFWMFHGDFWNSWHETDSNPAQRLGTLDGLTDTCLTGRTNVDRRHHICSLVYDGHYPQQS